MLDTTGFGNAKRVFDFFFEISKIPHTSTNTEKIADYLVDFARARSLWYNRDKANNVIIRKPATPGFEDRPAIIFQAHTDMVEDKLPSCDIDMKNEGLRVYRDGDFLKADGTTLGGDDGVGVAYALAILDSADIEHPEFEAVFTSDEEIGLIGAAALDTSLLHGKRMLNLDSDGEGYFTVGCAGGLRIDIALPYLQKSKEKDLYKITVSGLLGGHSGAEIHKPRANAIKILGEIIANAKGARLASITGGNADNAIPRYAEATLALENESCLTDAFLRSVTEEYRDVEPGIDIKIEKTSENMLCFDENDTCRIAEIIEKMPTGVYKMSEDIQGLVETSSNLGVVGVSGGRVTLAVSVRSSKNSEKSALCDRIFDIAKCFSAETSTRGEYPAWEYKKDSELCDVMKRVYLDTFGREPTVMVIHAGLECGIFSQKIEGFDCVSLGPNGFDIHTTDERLSISSTVRVYDYLIKVLKSI